MRSSGSMVGLALLLCAGTGAPAHGIAEAIASTQSLTSLPPGEVPVPVSVGLYLVDFVRIDEANLGHVVSVYMTVEWRDTRLAERRASGVARTLDQIWHPNIELMNEYSQRQVNNSLVSVTGDGRVKYEERFESELSSEFDLRRFPFDRQTLRIGIESFRYDERQVRLHLRAARPLKNPAAFLPDWYILEARQIIDQDGANPEGQTFSRYTFAVDIQRKVGYYLWNAFLPLALITLLPWAVFWLNCDDLRARVSISTSALLTAIALSLVISGSRPRVSYMTFLDALFLNSYVLMFLSMVSVIGETFLLRRAKGRSLAEHLSPMGRVGYPLVLILSNALLALEFLG